MVNGVAGLYGKKSNSAQFGVFDGVEGRETFPDEFIKYTESTTLSDDIFLALTKEAMKCLYRSASGSTPASGGYMLFADYKNDQGRFFLSAMVKQRPGITIKNLIPEELLELDLDRLHQAARINFNRFDQYKKAAEDERNELSYLSFVSPKSNKSTSGYFIKALGCTKGVPSAKATDAIMQVTSRFYKQSKLLKSYHAGFKTELINYLQEKESISKPAKLSEIEVLVRQNMPLVDADKQEVVISDFYIEVNDEGNGVPSEFSVHKATVNKYVKVKYKSDNWHIEFELSALGVNRNSEIYLDEKTSSLVITKPDDELISIIKKELMEREGLAKKLGTKDATANS